MKMVIEIDYGRSLILDASPAMMHAVEQVFGGQIYEHSYVADAYSTSDRAVRIRIEKDVKILDVEEVKLIERNERASRDQLEKALAVA